MEKLIGEYFRLLTPDNITIELRRVIKVYTQYLDNVYNYIRSIDSIMFNIKQKYEHIYKICITEIDGITTFNFVGQILLFVMRQLENMKQTWTLYVLKFHAFLDVFKKHVSLFVMRVY